MPVICIFTIVADVVASATKSSTRSGISKGAKYDIQFTKWTRKATDYYHWNKDKHIVVPNPDYNSNLKNAVAPKERTVTVYHSNAIRLEKAGMAKPFRNESQPWDEADAAVVGPDAVIA